MPDEIAELRDLYLTATQNTASADDAADAADNDLENAREAARTAAAALDAAHVAETAAREAYVRGLRAAGMIDTASGPMPVPGVTLERCDRCQMVGHAASAHDGFQ